MFLKWTAIPMMLPKAYGTFHLSFFLIGLTVCFLSAFLLRNANEKQHKFILLTIGGFLILSEIYKQLFYTFIIGGGKYQWWIFPFQLCSIPMYLCIIVALIKNETIKRFLCDFMISFNLLGGFISFLEPSGLLHEYWSLTLHAFIWHMLLVFLGLYLGFSKRGARKISDYKGTVIVFVSLCLIAFIINLIFKNVSQGSVNMFYVGPSISPIIVFKDIAQKYGWYINTPIYMACLCLGAFIFFMPFALYNSRKIKADSLNVY